MSDASSHFTPSSPFHQKYINYTTVTGFFLQDDPATNASAFNYSMLNLGLIERPYDTDDEYDPQHEKTQWQRFEHYVFRLNRQSGRHLQYKVLFMGRHGEGYHNVAESFYGTPAWDCYWSLLDGNGTVEWADARITEKGVAQALVAHAFWKEALANKGIPAPESYYTSPLVRCLETAKLTFSGLKLPSRRPFKPVVKELLREAIGIHTCDRRSSKSWIQENYPDYAIEAGFAEEDPFWLPDLRESNTAQVARLKKLLDDVFTTDDSTWVSFTSHSGAIGSLLKALGHRTFSLQTGGVIPVLVKAETIGCPPPTSSIQPSTTAPTCTVNPTPAPTG
ncbi:phosphoglycerate mutase family protein [Patellaria atrata CBS 101060]|uniref:Phosphoglycerate mutase family protein n=1 Tax=Patellaria atrata CBS 101060 TaxID=1346257 RepID=A0A9P4VQN2_9PEZI|nr:phosphoglycerate mutase family protein [Patellaria atrata CBS 101060]